MTDIGFYHLTRTGPEKALPALLSRTLAAGQRALVRCRDAERVSVIDAALWDSPDFLPHGIAADGDSEIQPIWLSTTDENPNGASFLFLIDGTDGGDVAQFTRVFDLFDGNDPAQVAAARTRWTSAKSAGHGLTYWQQTERGWDKKG